MDIQKFYQSYIEKIFKVNKKSEYQLSEEEILLHKRSEYNGYIFENKWFDDNYYLNIIKNHTFIYLYKEDIFIYFDKKRIRINIEFWDFYSYITNFLTEKNIMFVNLCLYEMGNNIFNIKTKKNELLSVIVIPEEYIEKENNRYSRIKIDFFYKNFYKTEITDKKPVQKQHIFLPDKKKYIKDMQKIRRYIINGYTYQINHTDRIFINKSIYPFDIYKKIRNKQNSYTAFFTISKNRYLISDTPERLFKLHKKRIITEPIKGTISTKIEDYRLKLLKSQKDIRELSMITDLLRNDICSLIKKNSLNVEFPVLMELDEVAHLYSKVTGIIKDNSVFSDIMKSLFPGGSITGVPKKMTMKIISHIEQNKRKTYTGSLGIVKGIDKIDFNILIRSFYYEKSRYIYGAGGGITIASDIEEEWNELLNKSSKINKIF